jgi:serine/threonine protein kinase
MDFGTGREIKREPSGNGNDFAGTPLYLAPEVFAGQPRTPASEIYSLGVLLYFLVTGAYPVEGDSRTDIARQHDRPGRRRPLRDVRPDLPDNFIRVVERATSETPEQRYRSAGELEAALLRVLSPPVPERAPVPVPSPVPPGPDWKKLVIFAASIVLVVGLASLAVDRMTRQSSVVTDNRNAETLASGTIAAAPPQGTSQTGTYRIESAFYRESNGLVERLRPGARLAPGDALSLQVQSSIPMYFYVVNEDERGNSFLLFPLPGQALQNPLPPGQRHRLPAMLNGELVSWQVTSTGLQEHFLIVASPERSTSFDELFATLPQPVFGRAVPGAPMSSNALGVLRSVGGLTASPAKVDRQLRLMPGFSIPLPEGEEPGQGVWIRHATFTNPGK